MIWNILEIKWISGSWKFAELIARQGSEPSSSSSASGEAWIGSHSFNCQCWISRALTMGLCSSPCTRAVTSQGLLLKQLTSESRVSKLPSQYQNLQVPSVSPPASAVVKTCRESFHTWLQFHPVNLRRGGRSSSNSSDSSESSACSSSSPFSSLSSWSSRASCKNWAVFQR